MPFFTLLWVLISANDEKMPIMRMVYTNFEIQSKLKILLFPRARILSRVHESIQVWESIRTNKGTSVQFQSFVNCRVFHKKWIEESPKILANHLGWVQVDSRNSWQNIHEVDTMLINMERLVSWQSKSEMKIWFPLKSCPWLGYDFMAELGSLLSQHWILILGPFIGVKYEHNIYLNASASPPVVRTSKRGFSFTYPNGDGVGGNLLGLKKFFHFFTQHLFQNGIQLRERFWKWVWIYQNSVQNVSQA